MRAERVVALVMLAAGAVGVVACKSGTTTQPQDRAQSSTPSGTPASSNAPTSPNSAQQNQQSQQGLQNQQSQQSQQGNHSLPNGFQVYNDSDGTGQLVFAKFGPGRETASAVMRDCLGGVRGYFDVPPQILGAIGDQEDHVVQAIWKGTMQGQVVRGVATVAVGRQGSTFAILFDRPQAFATSYPRLARRLSQEMPRDASGGGPVSFAPERSWARQTAGDQSAAASVPAGWHVTGCAKGALDIVGPNQESIELGLAWPTFVRALPGYRGKTAPYMDPIHALYWYESNLGISASANSRVVETTQIPWQNGQAMYILQDVDTNQGKRRVFALVGTSVIQAGNEWLLYISYVAASRDRFNQEFAEMMKIWGSWKIDDRVFQERLQSALQSMKETSAILKSMNDHTSAVYDETNTAADYVLRGQWPVENTDTGQRTMMDQSAADSLSKYCSDHNLSCRQVPMGQLTGHQ
jgi:hypothetical protein